MLGVAGPFGLVAPVNGAGFGRSLGHGMSSIDFIVWIQPAVSGSHRVRACIPLGRDCRIVTSDSTVSSMSPVAPRNVRRSRRQSLGLSMLISIYRTLIPNNCVLLMSREHTCKLPPRCHARRDSLIDSAFERWAVAHGGRDRCILAVQCETLRCNTTIRWKSLHSAEKARLCLRSQQPANVPRCLQPKSFGAQSSSLH